MAIHCATGQVDGGGNAFGLPRSEDIYIPEPASVITVRSVLDMHSLCRPCKAMLDHRSSPGIMQHAGSEHLQDRFDLHGLAWHYGNSPVFSQTCRDPKIIDFDLIAACRPFRHYLMLPRFQSASSFLKHSLPIVPHHAWEPFNAISEDGERQG